MDENLHRGRVNIEDTRGAISRVVLFAFLFVLVCLVVPSVTGDTKGVPSLQWYGYVVVIAGVAALVAGGVARHTCKAKNGKHDVINSCLIPTEDDETEAEAWRNRRQCQHCLGALSPGFGSHRLERQIGGSTR